MPNRVQAKAALDAVIKKSRVHLYILIVVQHSIKIFLIFVCHFCHLLL